MNRPDRKRPRPQTARLRALLWALAAMSFTTFFAPPALARQSDSDLRKQNQQLTTQVDDLQKEIKAAQDKIKRLEERIAELEQQLHSARQATGYGTHPAAQPPPETQPEQVTIDESVPNASPRALFQALVGHYEKATAGLDMGSPGDPKHRSYLRRLDAWKAAVDREFRAPITWHVRVVEGKTAAGGQKIATLIAVDPKTDVRLGNPFDVTLPRSVSDRLARLEARGDLGVLVLRGTLIPDVRINDQRESRGSFDNPLFIGPFAEFGFTVEVISLQPAKDEEKDKEKDKGSTTKPAEVKPAAPPPPKSEPEKP